MILLDALALYAVVGLAIALAFVAVGVPQVLPPGTGVSLGARILLLPGATALWPYVLARWIKARTQA